HAIKMTTARYFTPDGRSIQAKGITPDIEVRPAELTELDSRPFFTEADLSGHLEGEDEEKARQEREKNEQARASSENRDYQLRSALNLLKGMSILSGAKDSEQ
ncbi:MAG: S41 family peptidase, partial [Marinobacter sp.]